MARRRAAALLALPAALSLAATAGSSGAAAQAAALPRRASAPQVFMASRRALSARGSFVLHGVIRKRGGRLAVGVRSVDRGRAINGRFTSTARAAGGFVGTVSFVRTGPRSYLRANARFWASSAGTLLPSAVLGRVSGTWIRLPAPLAARFSAQTSGMTVPARLAASFLDASAASTAVFEHRRSVHGQLVVPVRFAGGTVFVRGAGVPLPIAIVGRGSGASWTIRLAYPPAKRVTPPPHAETLAQLGR